MVIAKSEQSFSLYCRGLPPKIGNIPQITMWFTWRQICTWHDSGYRSMFLWLRYTSIVTWLSWYSYLLSWQWQYGWSRIYYNRKHNFQNSERSLFIRHILESLFIEILSKSNKNTILGVIYRPNTTPMADVDILADNLYAILDTINKDISLISYKSINDMAPEYLCELVCIRKSSRKLGSSNQIVLQVPVSRLTQVRW